MLATGMDPKGVMAELTGRAGGYSKGKGGSMHMFSTERRFFGGDGTGGAPGSLPGGVAEGMRVRAMRAAGDEVVEHARSGEGPILLEARTYRYRGHSMSDPA